MTVCKKCGICCSLFNKEGKFIKKCKFLIKIGNTTLCRVYNNNRLGRVMGTVDGQTYYCGEREKVKFNFTGCPFNKDGQELRW